MFRQTTLEEFKVAARSQKRAIVFQEFPCDNTTPTQAFLALNCREGGVLFESAVKDQDLGRYSLLAIEPFARFSSKGAISEFVSTHGKEVFEARAFEHLSQIISSLRLPIHPHDPPLVGGSVGFVAYDAVRLFEAIPDRHEDKLQLPDLFFLFHAVHIVFDYLKGTLIISIHVELTQEIERDYVRAITKISELYKTLTTSPQTQKHPTEKFYSSFKEELDDRAFCDQVIRAKEYIHKGDAFQIVLSRSFQSEFLGDPFDIYRALRITNPSPFMFYIETKEFAIAGSSPERLVRLDQGKLQTMPIAGTCPRMIGQEEQQVLKLLEDPKENAEHMMLVDLGRNDLGAIAKVGSVNVKELKRACYFPHTIHLVSQIEAEIAEGLTVLDALKAVFPAGTLSGAPKIRAMEIIDELEPSRRGLYGGAICTIDNKGVLDSCIAIRTAFFKEGIVSVRSGAGIVFDSDPQKEAEETRAKAKGVMDAVHLAMEGIL